MMDRIEVTNRNLDAKVVLQLRHDHVIEIYAVDDHGLEEYAGRLEHTIRADEEKIRILLKAIRNHVVEAPFSRRALSWLRALAYHGMLARWEDPGAHPTSGVY
jgi:hypothetical protein